MCSNLGTPKTHRFPFGTNGKVVVLGVPILKHFRVAVFAKKKIHFNKMDNFLYLFQQSYQYYGRMIMPLVNMVYH